MRTRRNLAANFAGSAFMSVLGLLLVPAYIKYLGVEAYGLIGAFTAIQSFSALIDAGFGTTLNRELARSLNRPGEAIRVRDLVRTLEVVYWLFAAIVAVSLIALSPVAARHWIQPEKLSTAEVARALMLMGVNFALVWPSIVYQGGLTGLQHQVAMNVVTAAIGAVRAIGALAVLAFISPTLDAFFIWQIVMNAIMTGALGWQLWSALPAATDKPAFRLEELRATRAFAAGVIGVTLLTLLAQQADKLVLSKLLNLESFGYYSFAWTVAAVAMARIALPVNTTFFPRFAELVSHGETAQLAVIYHRACQLVSVSVLPVAVVLAMFSPQILLLWTRNPDLVSNAHLLLTILVVGNGGYSLILLPYALQLAHGWTRLAFVANLITVLVLVPAMFVATRRWAAPGAAAVWAIVAIGNVLMQVTLMHRRLLRGELRVWYLDDVGKPLIASVLTAWAGSWLMANVHGNIATLLSVAVVLLTTVAAAALAVAWMRERALTIAQRVCRDVATWIPTSPN